MHNLGGTCDWRFLHESALRGFTWACLTWFFIERFLSTRGCCKIPVNWKRLLFCCLFLHNLSSREIPMTFLFHRCTNYTSLHVLAENSSIFLVAFFALISQLKLCLFFLIENQQIFPKVPLWMTFFVAVNTVESEIPEAPCPIFCSISNPWTDWLID